MRTRSLPLFVLLFAAARAAGQDAAEPASPDAAKQIAEFRRDFDKYVIETDDGQPLKLRQEPVLFWSNPIRNSGQSGAVFAWMKDGRPEVVASRFTYRVGDDLRCKHEFHSLSDRPLKAEFDGTLAWAPEAAGVTLRPVPDAPKPVANERLRLVQMSGLARRFSASITVEGQPPEQLRLVPRPLLRYGSATGPTTDGALFSWSLGTDPEAMLLLEVRNGAAGPRWEYAFARFHYAGLDARLGDESVWHVEPAPANRDYQLGDPGGLGQIYISFRVPIAEE